MNLLMHAPVRHPARSPRSLREAGLTLIELMIAITLGLLILAGLITVFANTSAARAEIERMSRQIENGRYAADLLSEDLQMAGYFGELNAAIIAVPGALPNPCSTAVADWGAVRVHVQGVDSYVSGGLSCLPADVRAGTDVIVVRRAKACVAGSTGCDAVSAGKPYIQVPLCSTETVTHTVAVNTSSPFNVHKRRDCTAAAVLRPYVLYIYYVSTTNDSGQSVPTLKRAEFDGAGFTVTPLVEGIEDMQIEYGVDADNDGKVDSYMVASAVPNAAAWASIITVRVSLLARNIDPSYGYTDPKTYANGLTAMAGATNYRRHAYSTLVRIQNASGRKDTP